MLKYHCFLQLLAELGEGGGGRGGAGRMMEPLPPPTGVSWVRALACSVPFSHVNEKATLSTWHSLAKACKPLLAARHCHSTVQVTEYKC